MSDSEQIDWDEVEDAASKMFNVWGAVYELDWAKEAWGHLCAAGLTSRQTFLDETAAKLRLVTLARIYEEFCGLAWDENPDRPIDYLAEHLHIDPVAIGVLAASAECDELEEAVEDYELHQAALTAVTDNQRKEIYGCLKAAYGDEYRLYSRIWHTRSPLAEEDTEGDEFELTDANSAALEYVRNGFLLSF
ncbi:MAG: hypothetical protein A3G40_07680 [Deltaproteobacteria bacterium RIFCSPLOWO2_12_FULL_57_22]|nr:MAG: hypothetical protein A3G40_07680 [Deltaproteobacteria bacterium RIFCSPLOWO2_12_FULL_57_22]